MVGNVPRLMCTSVLDSCMSRPTLYFVQIKVYIFTGEEGCGGTLSESKVSGSKKGRTKDDSNYCKASEKVLTDLRLSRTHCSIYDGGEGVRGRGGS